MWWNKGFYYLACPYSHELESVRTLRVEQSRFIQAALLEIGVNTYNPISHTHELVKYLHDKPGGYDFWHRMDEKFLETCQGVIVCQLPGWEYSKGILGELTFLSNTRGFFSARFVLPDGMLLGEWNEKVLEGNIGLLRDNIEQARA